VLQNYFNTRDLTLEEVPFEQGQMDRARLEAARDDQVAALVIQQPNFFGILEDLDGVAEMLHAKKALLVVSVDPISLPLVKTPAEYGADIVTGEGQGLGSAPSFGGPLLGFFAV
jgi:glycine dehydrogenase subunit 1